MDVSLQMAGDQGRVSPVPHHDRDGGDLGEEPKTGMPADLGIPLKTGMGPDLGIPPKTCMGPDLGTAPRTCMAVIRTPAPSRSFPRRAVPPMREEHESRRR